MLTENSPRSFVALYDRDDVESVGLDDAARRLGVERRRIYDIVNVLESIGVSSFLPSFVLFPLPVLGKTISWSVCIDGVLTSAS